MKHSPILILLVGHDQKLLETKQWVLQSRGYRVLTAATLSAIAEAEREMPVSLLLLCEPLRPGERAAAIALARARWPEVRHLTVAAESSRSPNGILGQLLHTMDGSTALLDRVQETIRGQQGSGHAQAS